MKKALRRLGITLILFVLFAGSLYAILWRRDDGAMWCLIVLGIGTFLAIAGRK